METKEVNVINNEQVDVKTGEILPKPEEVIDTDIKSDDNTDEQSDIVNEYEQSNVITRKTTTQIIKELLAKGCRRLNSVKIKNTTVKEETNYTRVTFTLMSFIDTIVTDENGKATMNKTNFLYTSTFALSGILKENEDLSYLNTIVANAKNNLGLIFNGASVDILQQVVEAGQPYYNPFSNNPNPDARTYDNAMIINYIINIKLSKTGERMAMRIADKMVDRLLDDSDGLIPNE